MRNLSVIGSTGSIGRQTLEVVDNLKSQGVDIAIEGLSAQSNIDLLEQQIRKYHPSCVCVTDAKKARELAERFCDSSLKVYTSEGGLRQIASLPKTDMVLVATVGISGLEPTVAAIKAGKRVALANKETLVTAGSLVMRLAQERGVDILPVDSEHSAILQCIQNQSSKPRRLLLTASGGPFFGMSRSELESKTPEQALQHPNWSMGSKVTIDSATMMNKGLEVLEASHLFHVPVHKIEVLVHRQSIVHSMVEFADNAVIAQLGVPDMKLPIQYALTYPERKQMSDNQLDLTEIQTLTFEKPDQEAFGCLALAYEAARIGGTMPCVMNAANEISVKAYLMGKIGFLDIEQNVRKQMEDHSPVSEPELEDIFQVDRFVRQRMTKDMKI